MCMCELIFDLLTVGNAVPRVQVKFGDRSSAINVILHTSLLTTKTYIH